MRASRSGDRVVAGMLASRTQGRPPARRAPSSPRLRRHDRRTAQNQHGEHAHPTAQDLAWLGQRPRRLDEPGIEPGGPAGCRHCWPRRGNRGRATRHVPAEGEPALQAGGPWPRPRRTGQPAAAIRTPKSQSAGLQSCRAGTLAGSPGSRSAGTRTAGRAAGHGGSHCPRNPSRDVLRWA